jgi:hypothetical protein
VITRRVLLAASIAVVAAACGDDDALNLNGSLSFNHSGSVSGTFNAVGRVPLFSLSGSAWAAAGRDDQEGVLFVTALVPRASARFDMITVVIPRLSPGSAGIAPLLNCAGGGPCAFVTVEFGASEDDADFTHSCFLESGTVALASITDNRASGSFSGGGECTTPSGTVTAFTITNGAFDVPVISDGVDFP